jgi:PHD/YefM family antitoxin component YafN of YafNO toxin-antitoxin module
VALITEDEWVEARLAEAPELTPEQIAHLRRLLAEVEAAEDAA